jgi:hypothetical protein
VPEDPAQRGVGAHDVAVQRHRGHADGRVVEDALEPLDLLLEHFLVAVLLLGLVLQRLPARLHPVASVGDGLHELGHDVVERGGLGEVGGGAELQRAQGQRLLVEAAEHDDPGLRRGLEDLGQRAEAVEARHRHVEQHRVGLEPPGQVDGVVAVGSFALDHGVPGEPKLGAHQRAYVGGVVDQDDAEGARRPGAGSCGRDVPRQRPRSRLAPCPPAPPLLSHVRSTLRRGSAHQPHPAG